MDRNLGLIPSRLLRASVALTLGLSFPLSRAAEPVDEVQSAVAQWAKVRGETARLDSDWQWQRTLMQSTLDALKERVGQLECKRDELLAKTAAERRETAEIEGRRRSMAEAAVAADAHLRELDQQLLRLRAWLPPRLQAALELPYRSLEKSDLPLGERMQHTMTILNRCMLFNRATSCGEELVVAEGGQPKLMEVVYWGMAHGYALDRAARIAYFGFPDEKGWTWTPAPAQYGAVERLIAAAEDKAEPELVLAPVRIGGPAALNPQH